MIPGISGDIKGTTSYKVVVPFYIYASLSFLAACILIAINGSILLQKFHHPHILAIAHLMILGWGTMIIMGASHQLIPVITGHALHSEKLAKITFYLSAAGIPLLVYGFYTFNMGHVAKWGGRFVAISAVIFFINLLQTAKPGKSMSIFGLYYITAGFWLTCTVLKGLVLVYNFTFPILKYDTLHYLPLHAHTGIIGWFLMLVSGVSLRLIPMFLISKYNNPTQLKWIYALANGGLLLYIVFFNFPFQPGIIIIPVILILLAVILNINYCYMAFKERIRKTVDEPMKISLISLLMLLIPVLILIVSLVIFNFTSIASPQVMTLYGYIIIFGWITSIILGMTFKTLPFIVWNKIYKQYAVSKSTPSPKDLYSEKIFHWMGIAFISSFFGIIPGIMTENTGLLMAGILILLISSALYNYNVFKIITHKAQ